MKTLIALVNPLVFLSDITEFDLKIQDDYNSNLEQIIGQLEEQLASISSLVDMKQALLSLTLSLEFISFAITSLVSMNSSGRLASQQSNNQTVTVKLKSVMNKTEAQITRLINAIKNIDVKAILLDKVNGLEENLLSDSTYSRIETKAGSVLIPIMGQEVSNYYLF